MAKFKIGDIVKVKGLKGYCGRITFIQKGDKEDKKYGYPKYKVSIDETAKYWNEKSLKKVKKC